MARTGTLAYLYVPAFPRVGGPIGTPPATCGGRVRSGSDPGPRRGYLFIAAPSRSLPGAEERGEPYVNTASLWRLHQSSDPFYRETRSMTSDLQPHPPTVVNTH